MQTILRIGRAAAPQTLAPLLGHEAQIAWTEDGTTWLRLDGEPHSIDTAIACVPAVRYQVVDAWLIRHGQQVANDRLPQNLTWKLLDDVIDLQIPISGLAASKEQIPKQRLRLVRGGQPMKKASAILADLGDLHQWIDGASDVRLRRLRWVHREGYALVFGDPLPTIGGQYFVAIDRVLMPAGFQWTPAVSAADVLAVFAVSSDQWLVWESNDAWNVLDDDALIAMKRSGVRLLHEQFNHPTGGTS